MAKLNYRDGDGFDKHLEAKRYRIIRFFSPDYVARHPGPATKPVTNKTGLTLEEAQEHCQRDDTRLEGEWFDGYSEE